MQVTKCQKGYFHPRLNRCTETVRMRKYNKTRKCDLIVILFCPIILVIHASLPRRSFPSITLAASVTAVLSVVIMVLMSMSSSLSPMSGANFHFIVAWKVQATSGSLNFSRSNLSLCWFSFISFFRRTRKVIITRSWSLSMLLQECSLSCGCKLLIGSASSGCGVSHLDCAMSIF